VVKHSRSVVVLGATGAVGQCVLQALLTMPQASKVTSLGRRVNENAASEKLTQHIVDIHNPASYQTLLRGHEVAVCTLGVGQPSKISKAEFIKTDKDAVLAFAKACKANGVEHFQLLSSIGANANALSFYLRTKGELNDALVALQFERLSIFQPSMILTPTNRYGAVQALTLAIWPKLNYLLIGRLQSFRGVSTAVLGLAMVRNIFAESDLSERVEKLEWLDFKALAA
jgi:uncharacterized protein YbjT (DUF2867 family)